MSLLNQIANFFLTPVEQVQLWLQELETALGTWWIDVLTRAGHGITVFLVEGVAICAISYAVYCSCRIMCTNKDETFSEYINKSMIAGLCYFFAKCGGTIILHYLGV